MVHTFVTSTRSRRSRVVVIASCLTIAVSGVSAQSTSKPKVDPKAVDALRSMGTYLRSLKEFGVTASGSRDEILVDGQKVQVGGTLAYYVRTPDHLRADINTDRKQRTIYYDGKTLTVYAPRMHYFATVNAPPTIMATLDSARAQYGLEFPIADLFLWGTPRDGIASLTSATYIGPAYVNGVDSDQYAFRQPGVDWQLWVKRGNAPLPLKIVITTTTNSKLPQYTATLNWDVSAHMNDAIFAFVPPKGAAKILIASLDRRAK